MTSPAPAASPILVLDRVRKAFAGHTAVDDLSLAVPAGVIYGLLGPNGAGKTTTIRMIMDIMQPDAGSVRLFGAPAGGRSNAERIGYLPEERGLYRKMRVLDVLVFLGEMKGMERRRARQRAGGSWWMAHSATSSAPGADTISSSDSTAASARRHASSPTHRSCKRSMTTVNTPRSSSLQERTHSASCATWSRRGRGWRASSFASHRS